MSARIRTGDREPQAGAGSLLAPCKAFEESMSQLVGNPRPAVGHHDPQVTVALLGGDGVRRPRRGASR